jgi:hypothetical protein
VPFSIDRGAPTSPSVTAATVGNVSQDVQAVRQSLAASCARAASWGANARRMAEHIGRASKIVAEHAENGKVKIVYGRYDLDSGEVDFIGA